MTFPFNSGMRQQIRKVRDYAHNNIYQLDDMLDIMNGQMDSPGTKPEHLLLVPVGRWICYFLVDHPNKGRCHYFQIKPDASGQLPDRPTLENILKEFGIESPLLDEHIKVGEKHADTNILLPIDNKNYIAQPL